MTIQELLKQAKQGGFNRKFARLIREVSGEPFSPDGIKEKYGVSYYTWIRNEADEILAEQKGLLEMYVREAKEYDRGMAPYPSDWLKDIKGEAEPETKSEAEAQPEPETEPVPTSKPESEPTRKGETQANLSFQFPQELVTEAIRQLVPDLQGDVKKTIQDAAKELRPTMVTIPGRKEVEIKGKQHKAFKKSAALLNIHKQLFIAGPTGSGKTFLAGQLAEAFNLNFAHLSCTAGMSEAHITGRMTADGSYVSTGFVDAYENGGVFLFDEVDAADPNVLLLINSAIANGSLSIPNRKNNPVAKRHEDFYMIVSANTWGHGSMYYSGREVLDRAFLDRFAMSRMEVDYDTELELEITKDSKLTRKLQALREKVERPVSTRAIIDAYKMSEAFSETEILNIFTADWTSEEIAKASEVLK